jgi:hypothetical protein
VAATALVLAAQLVAIVRLPRFQSRLGQLELTRRTHPGAAAYLYAESEFSDFDYDGIISALFTPGTHILSPQGRATAWRFPPPGIILLDKWRQAPIPGAYLSPAARALAGR